MTVQLIADEDLFTRLHMSRKDRRVSKRVSISIMLNRLALVGTNLEASLSEPIQVDFVATAVLRTDKSFVHHLSIFWPLSELTLDLARDVFYLIA